MEGKIGVFILFEKEDRDLFLKLKQHLVPLESKGLISVWDEEQITCGLDRRQEIDSHLRSASLVLLLVSACFIASRDCTDFTKKALAMHIPPNGYVIPVLLHEVDWEYSDFGQLKPLPSNKKPIGSWTNRDSACVDVVKGIRTIVEAYEPSQVPSSQPLSLASNNQEEDESMSDSVEEQDVSFDVFLCHNSKDKDEVKKVAKQLQARGIHPWLDEWELRPGWPWVPLVEEQIKIIPSAAVFVSENDLGPWQRQETYALLNKFVRQGCPVIPVLLNTATSKPDLPSFLASMTWVDFREQQTNPLDQLIWGITGKKPDRSSIEPVSTLRLTITTPDDHAYMVDVPADTLVDQLLGDFLSQWSSLMGETMRSMRLSLRSQGAASSPLDRSSTLREAGLAPDANLMLVSEVLGPNEPISLMIEDKQGEHYITSVPLDTIVGQIADDFLGTESGTGDAVVEWAVYATEIMQLELEASLYDQGVCDNALLRIYRKAKQ